MTNRRFPFCVSALVVFALVCSLADVQGDEPQKIDLSKADPAKLKIDLSKIDLDRLDLSKDTIRRIDLDKWDLSKIDISKVKDPLAAKWIQKVLKDKKSLDKTLSGYKPGELEAIQKKNLQWLRKPAPFQEPNLSRDLDRRGLLDETLVVMTFEFGRTPNISSGDRNHHPPAFSSTLADAGIKGGHLHGATDAKGGKVDRDPVTPGELHATIGWAMGISLDMEIKSPNGRPFKIGDNSKPVMNVFA